MKRLIIACDGTWQTLETPDPTNVRKVCEAVLPSDGDVPQIVYYAPGIGTRSTFDKITGGAFGHGINMEIASAYTFLCSNYQLGDEIYLFGFSRGAYTVRSLAGLIHSCGILRREELSWLPNAYALYRRLDTPQREELAIRLQKIKGNGQTSEDPENSPIRINFLGVWDTVGALGIPDLSRVLKLDRKSQDKHRFHNTHVSPIVDNCRHAVAIDERRKLFRHTEMNPMPGFSSRKGRIRQVWFPGDHGSVGGGGDGKPDGAPDKVDKSLLANSALLWMVAEVQNETGLVFSREALEVDADPLSAIGAKTLGFERRMSDPESGDQPSNQNRDKRPFCQFDDIHQSAIERWNGDTNYRPKNLGKAHGERLSAG
ncbi:MAG: DUF2235 domain-containing protein [Pseudomonadota bacterium]